MAERLDTSRIDVVVNNKQAINALGKQEAQLSALTAEVKQLEKDVKAYNKAQATLNTKGIDKNSKAYKKAQQQVQDLQKSVDRYTSAQSDIDKLTKSIDEQRKVLGIQGQTLAQLTRRQRQLRQAIRNTTTEGTEGYEAMQKELEELNKAIARQNKNLKSTGQQAPQVKKVGMQFGGVKDTLTGIVGKGGKFGLVGVIATGIGLVVKEGLKLEKQFTKMRKQVARLTGETGPALGELTANVKALATTFDKDFNEVLNTANSLAQQMDISFDEALKLIEQGFLNGADAQGDFLDKVREYPIQFKQAGLSAEEFIKVASQEARGGVFNDKLLDSIKELGLRLRELTPTARKALEPLGGKFVDGIVADLQSGSKDIVTIFGEIIARAKELGLTTQETQTLVADLGAGPLEDLGGLEEAFEQLDAAMKINLNTTDELGTQQAEALAIQKQMDEELEELTRNFAGVGDSISNFFNKALANAIGLVNDLVNAFNKHIRGVDNTLTEQEKLIQQLPALRDEYDRTASAIEQNTKLIENQRKTGGNVSFFEERQKQLQASLEETRKQLTLAEDANISFEDEQRKRIAAQIEGDTISIEKQKEATKVTLTRAQAEKLAADQAKLRAEEAKRLFKEIEAESKIIEKLGIEAEIPELSILKAAGLIPTDEEKAEADKALADARARLALRRQILDETRQLDIENAATDEERIALMREEELRKANAHFDALTEQAKLYGLDTTAIFEARQKAILAIEKNFQQQQTEAEQQTFAARVASAKAFVGSLENIANSLAQLGVKNESFQKSLALTQVAIDTASAISSTIAAASAAPTLPQVIAQIAIGVGTVLSNFARVNSILNGAKKTTAPKFADGGGLARGPRHAQGGIPGWVKGSGAIEFEGGEFITNRKATATNIDVISTINQDRGKTRFSLVPQYAKGGQISPMAASIGRATRYQDGGITASTPSATPQAAEVQESSQTERTAEELNNTLQLLNASIQMLMQTPLEAFITQETLNDGIDEKTEIDAIENDVNL